MSNAFCAEYEWPVPVFWGAMLLPRSSREKHVGTRGRFRHVSGVGRRMHASAKTCRSMAPPQPPKKLAHPTNGLWPRPCHVARPDDPLTLLFRAIFRSGIRANIAILQQLGGVGGVAMFGSANPLFSARPPTPPRPPRSMRWTGLAMLIRSTPSFMGLTGCTGSTGCRIFFSDGLAGTRKTISLFHPAHPAYPVRFAFGPVHKPAVHRVDPPCISYRAARRHPP
jgi:hypothetical protein